MKLFKASAGLLVVSGFVLSGCHKSGDTPPSTTAGPTTMMAPETNGGAPTGPGPTTMAAPSANSTTVTLPASKPPAAKDLTHEVTKDQPYFLSEPGADPKPIGTLKAGSKCLVLIPGAQYSQVLTDEGISAYTPTDGLKPLGK